MWPRWLVADRQGKPWQDGAKAVLHDNEASWAKCNAPGRVA